MIAQGIAIGDVDGDGVQELVSGAYGPGVNDRLVDRAVVAQRADGTVLTQFPKPVPRYFCEEEEGACLFVVSALHDHPKYNTPAIADLDGDGLKEVLWVDPVTLRLFVWNVAGTPGPELADWPMYHHDPKHTNALPVLR